MIPEANRKVQTLIVGPDATSIAMQGTTVQGAWMFGQASQRPVAEAKIGNHNGFAHDDRQVMTGLAAMPAPFAVWGV